MVNRIKNYFTKFYYDSVGKNKESEIEELDFEFLAEGELDTCDEGLEFTYYFNSGDTSEEQYAKELEAALNQHRANSDYVVDSIHLSNSGLEVLLKTWQTLNSVNSGIALYQGHRGCQGVRKCGACQLLKKITLVINHACLMFENSLEEADIEASEDGD